MKKCIFMGVCVHKVFPITQNGFQVRDIVILTKVGVGDEVFVNSE
jgi:hypothetical protein